LADADNGLDILFITEDDLDRSAPTGVGFHEGAMVLMLDRRGNQDDEGVVNTKLDVKSWNRISIKLFIFHFYYFCRLFIHNR
jgi:hypothetical protein